MAGEIGVMCMGPQYVDVDFGDARLPRDAGRPARPGGALAAGLAARTRRGWVAGLFEAAMSGDRRARKIVDETARLIGSRSRTWPRSSTRR